MALWRRLTLTQRLSLVFALLLMVCSSTSAWMQIRASRMHELEVVQGLSRDLAEHIARTGQLMDANGLKPDAVRQLFSQLMGVNPSVEVYLLDLDGNITGHAAPADRLKRGRVNLDPVRALLGGARLPVLGDDPRSADARKVFSAAPLRMGGRDVGYVYVVLLGEAHDRLAARDATSTALDIGLWSIGLMALLCLVAGLAAFAIITRPLRRLTEAVRGFDVDGSPTALPPPPASTRADSDEIAVLDGAFRQMAGRLGEQWRTLSRQDQERRELIANISHDLRTPLASLHGYLETLSLKDASLQPAERRRYLGIALDQSRKVGGLAQSLFELARLEYGSVQPEIEPFALTDLVQDVFQKFELAAEARQVTLRASFDAPPPPVCADLGLIERVLTNLLDNALRHVPAGGDIEIVMAPRREAVEITLSDSGPGIATELREAVFQKPFDVGGARRGGGLGLRIVHRILQLHGREIALLDLPGRGAAFRFSLPVAKG
ncbi:sensory transduction histidine kinases [Bordetella ansorpii]|uniref:histidine kinase n=1 Tax=Bordetella ansorpii TaxID=288768 RepID=A0A157SH21_9BORD|nr:HAMP domain-containing sensor histidine kinase [Bordetella ansorpii]SAI69695.1 sensory transduction histidine kinases [Bordetella ansorpii]